MKTFFLFASLFYSVAVHSQNADSSILLSNSWAKLKTELQRRTDIAINLTSIFNKSGKPDKHNIEQLKLAARDLSIFLDSTKVHDSITVTLIYQKNNNLTREFSKALSIIIEDPKSKSQSEWIGLQSQLEGSENRLLFAKRRYNETCIDLKRMDLVFGSIQKSQ